MEFVNDHHEPCRGMGKLVESGNAFGTYQGLPACQFLFYGVQRTDGMGEVKIADVAHGMRQTLQSVEGRSSFEIQKHKMQIIANAMHQLISSSDFPEPVVPATMACGPDDARSIWNMPCSDMPMPFVGERTSQLRTMVRHMSGSLSRPCRCSKLMDGMSAKS